MRGVAVLALGLITLLSLYPRSNKLLKQAEKVAEEELDVECTAVAYDDCGGIKKVAMDTDDVKFTLTLLNNKYYADNYDNAVFRKDIWDTVEVVALESMPKHELYIDVYDSTLVFYFLVDATKIKYISVDNIRDVIDTIEPECEDHLPYIFVTPVDSKDLPLFRQLSDNWYGIGEDTASFYERVAGGNVASFILLDKGVTDEEIKSQLNTLY